MADAPWRRSAKRPAAFPRVIATSAEKGYGLPELRAEIAAGRPATDFCQRKP